MKHSSPDFSENSPIEQAAAAWTLRIDRGLSPEEQDAYTQWLAEDPRHREAMALYQWGWDEFDRLAGFQTTHHARIDPDLLAPGNNPASRLKPERKYIRRLAALPLAAALALAVFFAWPEREQPRLEVKPAFELMARIEQRALEDGSVVKINRGGKIQVAYSASERRVLLTQGEAGFEVAKDPHRPFIVNVSGIDVKAVGTVFSVRKSHEEVDVIVTEGRVNIRAIPARSQTDEPLIESNLEVGQMANVKLDSALPVIYVAAISQSEIEQATSWQPRLLDFDKAPLGDIIAEFNRRNPIQVALGDPSLQSVRLSSSFWSDNVEGFVRLMESSFGMEAEWRGSREIVLTKAH